MNENLFKEIELIVKECGSIVLNASNSDLKIENKEGNNNIVTKYDKLIENILKEKLHSIIPTSSFIGEESSQTEKILEEGYTFIVDPIDGTTNFACDFKLSAISVALLYNGELIYGICYNPYNNEFYKAIKGKGAFLNDERIYVSKKKLENGIVYCGSSPYYKELREESLNIQKKISMIAGDYRRFGSAVIEMCNIASGKAELYYELKLQPWDYAAATLIVEEAGGQVMTIKGEKVSFDKPSSVIASNMEEDYLKYFK